MRVSVPPLPSLGLLSCAHFTSEGLYMCRTSVTDVVTMATAGEDRWHNDRHSGYGKSRIIIHKRDIWHVTVTWKTLDLWKARPIAGTLRAFVCPTRRAVDKEIHCRNQRWPELTIAVLWISLNKRIQYMPSCFSTAERRVACSAWVATEFSCTIDT